MAQENIIIDLTDENLIVQPDIYVDGVTLDAYGNLTLTRTDNESVTVDLTPLLTDIHDDTYISGGIYDQATKQLILSYSDTTADISIDLVDIIFTEYGGTNYDPAKTDYPIGHIVSIPDGTAWVAMVNPQTAQPDLGNTQWNKVGSLDEVGGVAYSGTNNYIAGDVVSHGGKGYINQLDSIGIAPVVGGNAQWIDMSLFEYYAGEHTPVAGTEYPDTAGETAGAYWVVSGLVSDYTMTYGDFAGKIISNGDRFLWDGSSWLLYPAPAYNEYGGVVFNTNNIYAAGHIVGFGAGLVPYVCILDMTTADGSQDPGNKTYWKEVSSFEKGGVLWISTTDYKIGDIVSNSSDVYIAIQDNTGQEPARSPGQWKSTIAPDGEIEVGGVSWVSNRSYNVGDVVSEGTKIYMRINSGGSGTTAPSGDPVYWQLLDTSRASVGLWQSEVTYYEGDIVSWGDDIYVAPAEGVTSGTTPPNSPWISASLERGGISWETTTEYYIGDLVVENVLGDLTVFVSIVNTNTGNLPSASPSEWSGLMSSGTFSAYGERGGVAWNAAITYVKDDLAVVDTGTSHDVYVALQTNNNSAPADNLGTDWQTLKVIERGGTRWKVDTQYEEGDLVTDNDLVYRAAGDSLGAVPATDPVLWISLEGGSTPIGGIIMYDGLIANIPASWSLCDGTNGTPDLVDRFIYGTDSDGEIGTAGGSADAVVASHSHTANHDHGTVGSASNGLHTHTADHDHPSATTNSTGSHSHTINHDHTTSNTSTTGSHSHTGGRTAGSQVAVERNAGNPVSINAADAANTSSTGSHYHSMNISAYSGSSGSAGSHTHTLDLPNQNVTTGSNGTHSHNVDIPSIAVTTSTSGESGTNKNLPPYVKLAYIKRIA